MKSTIIPAQVTTVEDRIAGPLVMSQLMLLAAPIFAGSLLYVILPPAAHRSAYKLVLITLLAFICGLLAIRIKGKIILLWLIILLSYNLRPRYYVFNKNTVAARNYYENVELEPEENEIPETEVVPLAKLPQLSMADHAQVEAIIEHPDAQLAFATNRKGGLSVVINQVK